MAPDQAVAAVNLGEQGPSSVSEAVSHPDATTRQQYVVPGILSSGRENGKKSRKPEISEAIVVYGGSCASITLLFSLYSIKTFTALCHYSFRKYSQYTSILQFNVRPGELFSRHSLKADGSMSNSGVKA